MNNHEPVSSSTKKQIKKAAGHYKDWLLKHRYLMASPAFQAMLEDGIYLREIEAVVRNHLRAQQALKLREKISIGRNPEEAGKCLVKFEDRLLGMFEAPCTYGVKSTFDVESFDVVTPRGVGNDDIVEIALGRRRGILRWDGDAYYFAFPNLKRAILRLCAGQSNGGDGALLADGRPNVFYTWYCPVWVRWFYTDADPRPQWHAATWSRIKDPDSIEHHLEGGRVFRFVG